LTNPNIEINSLLGVSEAAPSATSTNTPVRITFADFGLDPEIQKAVLAQGYTTLTSIQAQSIPHVLAGRPR